MAITLNGDGLIQVDGTSTTQGRVRLNEDSDNGTNYVELQAAASLAANVTFTLPDADGTNGQVIQTNGSGALSFTTISGGGDYIMQVYSSPATWTKPAGLKAVKVTVIGGGGGGGGGKADPCSAIETRSGGGGGVAIEYLDAPAIPGPVSVTIGPGGAGGTAPGTPLSITTGSTGGTSSFGAFCSATGGGGGGSNAGSGGAGSGGSYNAKGSRGAEVVSAAPSGNYTASDNGGGNPIFMADGGRRGTGPSSPGTSTVGEAATANTGCGGGGSRANNPNINVAGGSGAAGLIIVEEFY